MAGQVKFTLTAEEAQAVQAFLRVVDAQKKVEEGARAVARSTREAAKETEGLKDVGDKIVGGFKNFAAGFVSFDAIKSAITGIVGNYKEATDANIQFQDSFTPLASLAQSPAELSRMKDDVIAFSNAGVGGFEDVVAAESKLRGETLDLSDSIRGQLRSAAIDLKEVAGGQLAPEVDLLTKVWRTYGEELGSPAEAEAKLLYLHQQTGISLDVLAQKFPEVLLGAKAAGYSFDQAAGSLVTLSKFTGDTEKSLTGLTRMFINMDKTQKVGVERTSDLVSQFKAMGQAAPDSLEKVFGGRIVANAEALVRASDQLKSNVDAIAKVNADNAAGAFNVRQTDQSFVDAEIIKSARQVEANAPVLRAQDPNLRHLDEVFEIAQAGAKLTAKPWEPPDMQRIGTIANSVLFGQGSSEFNAGLQQTLSALRQAGRKQIADDLALEFGEESGSSYLKRTVIPSQRIFEGDASGGRYVTIPEHVETKQAFTGYEDRQELANLRLKYPHLSAQAYTQYKTLESQDPSGKSGSQFLLRTENDAADREKKQSERNAQEFAGNGINGLAALGGVIEQARSLVGEFRVAVGEHLTAAKEHQKAAEKQGQAAADTKDAQRGSRGLGKALRE